MDDPKSSSLEVPFWRALKTAKNSKWIRRPLPKQDNFPLGLTRNSVVFFVFSLLRTKTRWLSSRPHTQFGHVVFSLLRTTTRRLSRNSFNLLPSVLSVNSGNNTIQCTSFYRKTMTSCPFPPFWRPCHLKCLSNIWHRKYYIVIMLYFQKLPLKMNFGNTYKIFK